MKIGDFGLGVRSDPPRMVYLMGGGGFCHLRDFPEMAGFCHLRDFGCEGGNLPSQGFDFFIVFNAFYDDL